MRNKYIYLIVAITVSFISCTENNNPNIIPGLKTRELVAMLSEDFDFTQIKNDQDMVTSYRGTRGTLLNSFVIDIEDDGNLGVKNITAYALFIRKWV
ncbi:MAG: hypothetical protein LBI67_07725 [Treponema sp.]|jgi:hypothetical protein|nr:hypothetical protein [Treponema sp.]